MLHSIRRTPALEIMVGSLSHAITLAGVEDTKVTARRVVPRAKMRRTAHKNAMEHKDIDEEEIWSAIRYLDPDHPEKDKGANTTASIMAVIVLLLIAGGVWALIWFRIEQP